MIVFLVLIVSLICPSDGSSDKWYQQGLNVVGGGLAPKYYPFFARLVLHPPRRIRHCGGSVIAPNYILTAAHCLYYEETKSFLIASQVFVYTGSNSLTHLVAHIVTNAYEDGYDHQAHTNDIAILKLFVPLVDATPITLDQPGADHTNQTASVIGYGHTTDTGGHPEELQYAQVRVHPPARCSAFHHFDPSKNICSGGDDGKGSCQGDSGGPVFLEGTPDVLIGIVSYGGKEKCAEYPGVSTRVAAFLPFIQETINGVK